MWNPELGSHHSTIGNNNGITHFRSEGGGSQRRFSEEVRFNQDLKGEEDFVRCKRILGARKELPGRETVCAKARRCEGTQLLERMAELGMVDHQVHGTP